MMKKHTRSILQELNEFTANQPEKELIIEDRAKHAIAEATNIIDSIKTDFETDSKGIVLESKIDIGRGPIANVIVTAGTLNKGDFFVSGLKWGKVRALINDKGENIEEANPSTPLEVLGINGAAKSGDDFVVLELSLIHI